MILFVLFVVSCLSRTVYLTVLFCPTYFSTRGAVVRLDTVSGNYSVVGSPFKWPIGDSGECSIQASPTVFFDRSKNQLFLDFFSAFGKVCLLFRCSDKCWLNAFLRVWKGLSFVSL
jgi:hypothetical protein